MLKYALIIFSSLCLFNIAVYANPLAQRNTEANQKQETGLGLGAIIGGLIAGPPGAIIGAAGGAWFGEKEKQEDQKLARVETELLQRTTELAYLENEFDQLRYAHGEELKKVKLDQSDNNLKKLSEGVSLNVYFRTGSAELNPGMRPAIQRLGVYLKNFPEIQLQLEAHADRRGNEDYNRNLSQQRAQAIARELINMGLDGSRIHTHAYGESKNQSTPGDLEEYVFDRRVTIALTLNTEI